MSLGLSCRPGFALNVEWKSKGRGSRRPRTDRGRVETLRATIDAKATLAPPFRRCIPSPTLVDGIS